MRDLAKSVIKTAFFLITFFGVTDGYAQPQPGLLADQMIERTNERLSEINRLEITFQSEQNRFQNSVITTYIKQTEGGNSWLETDTTHSELEKVMVTDVYDNRFASLIRGASSIESVEMNNQPVYKIEVHNEQLLHNLNEENVNSSELKFNQVTIWIDIKELLPRKMEFDQTDEVIEIQFKDYQSYNGLHIAHSVQQTINEMETNLTEEERAETRRALDKLEQQINQMPEGQRRAVEQQIRPQMEEFEAILKNDEMDVIVYKVTDVNVD